MRIMLIDGNNLLMRAVFAAERVPLQADGVPTAALLIFINLLSRHIKEEEPTHVVLCWDGGRSAYRTQMYPAYKANRGPSAANQDDNGPFSQAKEFLALAGIHYVERGGWEADDLIAAYWQNARRDYPDAEVVILSGDKDMLQLLDAQTTQVRPVSAPPTDRWDAARVFGHYGVPAEHLSKAMALIGDTSDNIPGVRGIGPKKADKILLLANYDLDSAVASLTQDQQRLAQLSFLLVDLCAMSYSQHGLVLVHPPAFRPTTFDGVLSSPLLRYLDRYLLESVKTRLAAQTLWRESIEEVRSHD